MTTQKKARKIIEEIAEEYGYLDKDMMDNIGQFNAEYRRRIDENWLKMENAASHSIKVLAKNIYGSGARFVFELLQNAEDNKFTTAGRLKDPPFISFKIYPKQIIVDCNEDGFTRPDLKAICSVGDSTKSALHGYIGAKGIGFKSVFIAASRVHIQSGNFSFEFRHKKTDPGLGMVRPIWVTPVASIANPLTRTTLYLHDQGDEEEIKHMKAIISTQFDDLHDTCLLFLRKLQQICVAFYDDKGKIQRSKEFRKRQIDEHRVSLETITVASGKKTSKSQIYHITKQLATGLAPSENREPPKTEEERRMSRTTEVVLAFPLTSDYEPQISRRRQELFAFLPLRPSDYKFHIHSDFDTNANRQDIITTSRRNRNIRDSIATTFLQAVFQFCEHPKLCYYWPLFLPPKDNGFDSFWSNLDVSIESLIKKNPILKSRHKNSLRSITDVVFLTNETKDMDGNPLFDDFTKDPFLSQKYPLAASDALKEYGLQSISIDIFIELLKSDLKSHGSKMRGDIMSEDWHSRVARFLSTHLDTTPAIRALRIVPLRDGRWKRCKKPIYLPATGDVEIPGILKLRVLDSAASRNPDRLALSKQLGVSEATTDQIRQSVIDYFISHDRISDFTVLDLLSYLYLTHQTGVHTREHYKDIWVSAKDDTLYRPYNKILYLPGLDDPYSPESLFTGPGVTPDFPVLVLIDSIMKGGPAESKIGHPSWKEWLFEYIGIQERLSLLSPSGDALSEPFLWVFNHRPDKFLGLFEHLWLHDGKRLLKNQVLVSEIEYLSAKELCKVDFCTWLNETWLPSPKLQELVQRHMIYPDQFPFLKIEGDHTNLDPGPKWNFLTNHFSVGKDDDIMFLLEILTCIERSCPDSLSTRQSQGVFDLYVAISAKLAVGKDRTAMRNRIEEHFDYSGIIDLESTSVMWTDSSSCLWAAPPGMTTMHSLKSIYTRRGLSDEDMSSIENLFHRTLGIRNATCNDIITELKELRDERCEEDGRITGLYRYLHDKLDWEMDTVLRFEEIPLIFVRQQGVPGWYRTSYCLWSSETSIRGKVTLDDTYEGLKAFFIDGLGVKSLTLQMVYDELRQSPNNSPEEVKVALRSLNEFLQTEPVYLDPEPIREAKVFPIRYPNGNVSLSSVDVGFAIADREKLKVAFEDRISLLDFDLEDVRRLKPLFEWLRLQDRYLSSCVKEDTSITGDSGTPILSGKRYLRAKAYYITRVAATFNSPRFRHNPLECYEALRMMDVREIDNISSVLKISQNGQLFESRVATANEHIDETGGNLTIYVPRESKKQDICFASVLPRKLAAWLMRHPRTHFTGNVEVETIFALTSIFASDKSVLDYILEDQGIIQITLDNNDENEGLPVDQDERDADTNLPPARTLVTPESSRQEFTPTDSSDADALSDIARSTDLSETLVEAVSHWSHMSHQGRPAVENYSRVPATAFRSARNDNVPSPHVRRDWYPGLDATERGLQEDGRYLPILVKVVDAARKANFPHGGAFDMQDLRDALPDGDLDTYQSFDGLDVMDKMGSGRHKERDKRVGAAGELYVFELLSKLELPGWGRDNWQSTIRTYANVHPDYADLSHWSRRETADLVYVDASGRLTSTLIEAGFLTSDEWSGKQPTYYFEVKTTTGPCKTPFYMSGTQYRLMERIHYNQDRSEVYIIFRIHSILDSGRINYCVYMDPKKLRDEGRLAFTEGTWSVRPGSVA